MAQPWPSKTFWPRAASAANLLGKRLAFAAIDPEQRGDIWVQDIDRDVVSRLTHLPRLNVQPVWTPDGANLVFESVLGAGPSLYWIRADGSGEAQRLTDDGIRRSPCSFSPDGKRLAYMQQSAGHSEIWTVPLEGDRAHPRLGKGEGFPHSRRQSRNFFTPSRMVDPREARTPGLLAASQGLSQLS